MHREVIELTGGPDDVRTSRRAVVALLTRAGFGRAAAADAALCASEAVTNAFFHAGGATALTVLVSAGVARVEVRDRLAPVPPGLEALGAARRALIADATDLERPTGRGLSVISELTTRWGVEPDPAGTGKVVWFELDDDAEVDGDPDEPPPVDEGALPRDPAVLLDVPIRLFLASEAHLESLLRELQLIGDVGAEQDVALLRGLAGALRRNRAARTVSMAEARRRLRAGDRVMTMRFPVNGSTAADAAEFLGVVEVAESLTRQAITLETPESDEMRAFRRWYVSELVRQASGLPPEPCPFTP